MNKYGLVILNYNSADDTISCAKNLLSFKKKYKIIIVDNNSSDDSVARITAEFDSEENVDVICNKDNKGYSAGNNIGMRHAISTYNVSIVGVINPDIIIPNADIIDGIADVLMSDESYAVAGGAVLNIDGEFNICNSCWSIPTTKEIICNHFILNNRKNKAMTLKICSDNAALTECVAGCFFLAKASAMEKIGFLDENVFLYNEENILGIKCKNNGYKEVVVLNQFYIHNHKWKKQNKKALRKRLMTSSIGYKSRKYMCETYYRKRLLPFLAMIEMANKIVIIASSIKAFLIND